MPRPSTSDLVELKIRLSALDLDQMVEGDTAQWLPVGTKAALWYTPDGELIGDTSPETMEQVGEFMLDPTNRRFSEFRRGDHMIIVATKYTALNMDPPMSFSRPPVIFETLVFFEPENEVAGMWRYITKNAAHAGHEAVAAVCREWAGTTEPGEVPCPAPAE